MELPTDIDERLEECGALVAQRRFAALRQHWAPLPAADIAELIIRLPPTDAVALFRILPTERAADVFEYLDPEDQTRLLEAMRHEEVAPILNEMSPDDRTALLEELPAAAVTRLLRDLEPAERRTAQALLNYPEDSVGRLMTTEFLSIRDEWTVARVLEHIRQHGRDREYLNVLYVTNELGLLLGEVRLREFVLQPADKRVSELRPALATPLHASDPKETAVDVFRHYDRTMLPVIDSTDHIVGVVTVDDVLDVAEEETTRDIQQIGGQEALDAPYLRLSIGQMVRKRAVWLVILLLGEMLTATTMGIFQDEIARAVILALFVPLIISSGGNSGSQAATLMIRALALEEIELRDWWLVLRREIVSGLGLGCILGVIGFLRIAAWSMFSDVYGPHWVRIAATVGLTLVGVVLWGSLAGSMLPFLLKRLGADPAASSAPFVSTLVDVTGLLIYFSVAYVMLQGTML